MLTSNLFSDANVPRTPVLVQELNFPAHPAPGRTSATGAGTIGQVSSPGYFPSGSSVGTDAAAAGAGAIAGGKVQTSNRAAAETTAPGGLGGLSSRGFEGGSEPDFLLEGFLDSVSQEQLRTIMKQVRN